MPVFDSHTREQLRRRYAEAWRKHLARLPLTPLEAMIADVIGAHPEYQAIVGDAAAAGGVRAAGPGRHGESVFTYGPSSRRPRSAVHRSAARRSRAAPAVQARLGDRHRAEHVLMEALGETLWQAHGIGRPPDEEYYMSLARRRLQARTSPKVKQASSALHRSGCPTALFWFCSPAGRFDR